MNRRTKRRLIVLAIVVGLVVVAGVGGTAVRKIQRQRLAEASLTEGLAAYEQGDYPLARRKLLTHLRIEGPQAEALTALGDAQRHVVEPNFKHLVNARSSLEQAVVLDPDNTKAREILLEIHAQLGNWQELASVATALLEDDPDNPRYARRRIEAHLQRGANDAALEAARAFVQAQDGSIDSHLEMLRVYRRTQRNARQQREYLDREVAPTHEGTTSLAVLRATVEFDAGRTNDAARLLTEAAQAGPTEGRGARLLLESMELIAATLSDWTLYEQSETWLVRWLDDPELAPYLLEVAAGRAWRDGDPQGAVDFATRALDTEPQSEAVFAWGVLGAIELGSGYEAQVAELRDAFEAMASDEHRARAEGWRLVMDAAQRRAAGSKPEEESLLPDHVRELSNRLGSEAVAVYYDALADIGRRNTRAAIGRLAGLGQQPSWRRARFVLVRVLVSEGRAAEALGFFFRDERLVDLPGGGQLLGEALSRQAEGGGALDAEFGEAIDEMLENLPDNPVALATGGRYALARDDTELARELARRLIEVDAAQASMSAVRFAIGLEAADPALARSVVDRVAQTASGVTQVAAAASGMALLGDPEGARAYMARRAGESDTGTDQQWTLARIQLATTIGDEASMETLERLSADNADDPQIQLEILSGPAIWEDLDRTGQVVARLREAQGDSALDWRIFEARRLLERDDSVETAASAAELLGPVFASDRGKRNTEAMLLAADAFARTGEVESELEALRNAADGDDPLAALPRLIDRLQRTGRTDEAGTRLRQFVDAGNVSTPLREARVQLLQRQGMRDLAARDIAALADAGEPQYVLRAGVQTRAMGSSVPLRDDETAALRADLAPEHEIHAARLLARVGRLDEGLARLESLPEDSAAGTREVVVARFLSEHGRETEAIERLTDAAETQGDPDLWQEVARMLVAMDRIDEAIAALERGIEALPGNAALVAFRDSIVQAEGMTPFERMARVLASNADRADASEELVELGGIAKDHLSGQADLAQTAAELDALSERRATLYPMWPLIIAAYEQLGQPDRALQRARDAVAAMPGDARPARDATQLMFRQARYELAASMADRWRSLANDPDAVASAELALGVAEFFRGNIDRTIGLLEPHTDRMMAAPAQHATPLRALLEAFMLRDRMGEAGTLLQQLVAEDARWAETMASLAGVAPATPENVARGRQWLEDLSPMLRKSDRGVVGLASAYMSLYGGTANPEFARSAIALAQAAQDGPTDSWQLRAVHAQALESMDRHAQAVAMYERAMALAGQPVPALLNNAAWLLTSELGEHGRAATMARRAVTASETMGGDDGDRATFHHTLGAALLASDQPAEALEAFEAGLRLAESRSLRLGRAEALAAVGRRAEARREFDRLSPDSSWSERHRAQYDSLSRVLEGG